jgi:hypothetical protein
MSNSVSVDDIEATLSEPGEIDLEAYAAKVRILMQDDALSLQPRVHLAVAKGYHELKSFENAIQFAEQTIALSKTAADESEAGRVREWAYLVKAECLRKLNRRFAELRMLVQYNRVVGNREDFKLQEKDLLQEYSRRIHARAIVLFPVGIVGVVVLHRLLGWFASATLYTSILLPLIVLSGWSAFHSRSFKKVCSRLMTMTFPAAADL